MNSHPLPSPPTRASILPRISPSISALILTLLLCGCASNSPWKKQAFALSVPFAETAASAHTNFLALRRVYVSPLFEGKSFVYRTGENRYDQDPYAEFLITPAQMLDECARLYLRGGHAFADVLEPGSGLRSSCGLAVSVNQLYGDFGQPTQPFAVLEMHFILYRTTSGEAGRLLWQQGFSKRVPISHRTAEALITGWNSELQEIMGEVNRQLKPLVISDPFQTGPLTETRQIQAEIPRCPGI